MSCLTGKIFAVTGAASGIGRATALLLASHGASVCAGDVNEMSLQNLSETISAATREKFTTFPLDIGDRQSVRGFIEHTLTKFGHVDGFANVAGITGPSLNTRFIWEIDSSEFESVFRVNAQGTFNCLAEQLKPGILGAGGSIVNTASFTGIKGVQRSSVYGASKHAMLGLTKNAAIDAGPRNIRVNAVAPGVVETPMLQAALSSDQTASPIAFTPIQRFGKPEEVADVIAFLLSDAGSFVTGSTYSVDGGWNA